MRETLQVQNVTLKKSNSELVTQLKESKSNKRTEVQHRETSEREVRKLRSTMKGILSQSESLTVQLKNRSGEVTRLMKLLQDARHTTTSRSTVHKGSTSSSSSNSSNVRRAVSAMRKSPQDDDCSSVRSAFSLTSDGVDVVDTETSGVSPVSNIPVPTVTISIG